MIKKIILILLTMQLWITGCDRKVTEKYDGDTANSVSMIIKNLSATSATVVIKDLSGNKNAYAEDFAIYRKINGEWYQLESKGTNIVEPRLYFADENNTLEFHQNWNNLYGTLSSGEYKLVKSMEYQDERYYFSADFTI